MLNLTVEGNKISLFVKKIKKNNIFVFTKTTIIQHSFFTGDVFCLTSFFTGIFLVPPTYKDNFIAYSRK